MWSDILPLLQLHWPALSWAGLASLLISLALLVDWWLGEPRRRHPLVGFGQWSQWWQQCCRRIVRQPGPLAGKMAGALAWGAAVVPPVALCAWLMHWLSEVSLLLWGLVTVLGLYLTLGAKSLISHADNIFQPLSRGDLDTARQQTQLIVSRDTQAMDERQITSAAVESVLENGNDAVFGALFWFLVAGLPGALAFRLINTLDAMWGYKTERYRDFGYVAARMDDLAGWLPARLTALTYAVQGNFPLAMHCWRTQAALCASPNGGVVMCSGAGALVTRIGGPAVYHGQLVDKIYMGSGDFADYRVIPRANRLVLRGCVLWVVCLVLISLGGV